MLKFIKKILLSSLSILGVSFVMWLVLLLNPGLLYAKKTQMGMVTVYHQQELAPETEIVIKNAIDLIRTSELYHEDIRMDLCLNDGSLYPELWIYKGYTAYSFMHNTVMYRSEPDFKKNYTQWQWPINHYQLRKWNLTELLAHEFMHVCQYHSEPLHTLRYDNWKIEGYAEYQSRKHRGTLSQNIKRMKEEWNKEQVGIPWVEFADGTGTGLFYFERWLVIQYLMEEKGLTYRQILDQDLDFEALKTEMVEWVAE